MPVFRTKAVNTKGSYVVKRPLLDFARSEVTFLTTLEELPISVDSTNQLGGSSRSQIRHLLVPLIRQLGFSSFLEDLPILGTFKNELTGTRTRN
jgi:tRNA(Ile)-lysidine synthase TilS/MesJ